MTYMSKLRNTPGSPRRDRHTLVASAIAGGVLAASMLAACSSEAHNPTEPASAAKGPAMAYASAAVNAPTNSWDAQQQYNVSQFASLAMSWHTSSGMMQNGTRLPAAMTCNAYTAKSAAVSQWIAPSTTSRTIQLGNVGTLTIPAGAVTTGFQLSASAVYGAGGVSFDFQPHGTQFAKALTVTANYQGCTMLFTSPLNFFFVNDQGGILQTMPSVDNRSGNTIQGLTDHFSHYMVAWS